MSGAGDALRGRAGGRPDRDLDRTAMLAAADRIEALEAENERLTIEIHGCGCPAPYDTCPHAEPMVSQLDRSEAHVALLRTALLDAYSLLPPERVRLLSQATDTAVSGALVMAARPAPTTTEESKP